MLNETATSSLINSIRRSNLSSQSYYHVTRGSSRSNWTPLLAPHSFTLLFARSFKHSLTHSLFLSPCSSPFFFYFLPSFDTNPHCNFTLPRIYHLPPIRTIFLFLISNVRINKKWFLQRKGKHSTKSRPWSSISFAIRNSFSCVAKEEKSRKSKYKGHRQRVNDDSRNVTLDTFILRERL